MPTLVIKLKSGHRIEIFFPSNKLMTRKKLNADHTTVQMFTNPEGTFGLTIKESEIESVEKREGMVIALPNHKPGPMGI